MTYKNIKFEDSPVMRSLEKLAVNKGLVKPDVISKTASAKAPSLKPGKNFEENILNLCSALRTSGFTKQAVEVETKFFNLKKADSLYNISGNTGEEEIGAAHPDGSHQMKDVEGDALVETVFDTQKAIQQMIAKKPTGKLAATLSAVNMIKAAGKVTKKAETINALKIILSEESEEIDQTKEVSSLYASGIAKLEDIFSEALNKENFDGERIYMHAGENLLSSDVTSWNNLATANDHLNSLINNLQKWKSAKINVETIYKVGVFENAFETIINKSNSIEEDRKSNYISKARSAWADLKKAADILRGENHPAVSSDQQKPAVDNKVNIQIIADHVKHYQDTLKKYESMVFNSRALNDKEKISAKTWINTQISEFSKIQMGFDKVPDTEKASAVKKYQEYLAPLIEEVHQFYTDWLE